MQIYCINEQTRAHSVTVAAVNDGKPLTYGKGYDVDDDVAEFLLARAPDHWSEERPALDTDTEAPQLIDLNGIGDKTVQALAKQNIYTPADLVAADADVVAAELSGVTAAQVETWQVQAEESEE